MPEQSLELLRAIEDAISTFARMLLDDEPLHPGDAEAAKDCVRILLDIKRSVAMSPPVSA